MSDGYQSADLRYQDSGGESFNRFNPGLKSYPIPVSTRLVVSDREPSKIAKMLTRVPNLDVVVAAIPHVDYMVDGHLLIIRKTPEDFADGVVNSGKWLFQQADVMGRSGVKSVVLLEGDVYSQGRMKIVNVDGMKSYLLMRGLYIFETRTMAHSAGVIAKLIRHSLYGLGYPDPAGQVSERVLEKRHPAFYLSCIPGISDVLACRLYERFGSIAALCLASRKQLMMVEGIGHERAECIMENIGSARAPNRQMHNRPARARTDDQPGLFDSLHDDPSCAPEIDACWKNEPEMDEAEADEPGEQAV